MNTEPTVFLNVVRFVELGIVLLAVGVLSRGWRHRGSTARGWALAVFVDLGLIMSVSFLPLEEDDGGTVVHLYTRVLIGVLLLVPLLLLQFAYSLGAVGRRQRQLALGLTAVQLVWTFLSPPFPQEGEHRSAGFLAFLVMILVSWTLLSLLTAIGLWRAGNGQPAVVRNRMRALGVGAVLIALNLVAGSGSSEPDTTAQVVRSSVGALAICLLVVGFVVPSWLRSAWRDADLTQLTAAERELMVAVTPADVATSIVPAVIQVFGASGAALLSSSEVLACSGMSHERLTDVQAALATSSDLITVLDNGAFACRVSEGWLVVQAGTFAPLFGAAEISLLSRIGSFTDLAMQRCRLYAQEARSRAAADAANAELQTLLNSVSHDLRNPIISVLGYVDVLLEEGGLSGEPARYLDRISVNAHYMQNLIHDLLELSRIGRSEPPAQAVALRAVAESVAQEVAVQHRSCAIFVEGDLPVLWISELRARQLLTNLLDNAAKHGASTVTVSISGADLLVADNGPGIPVQLRDKAFEVFERLDVGHTGTPGTGMGLPIVKRICESWGGAVSLGDSPGGGLTVQLRLPLLLTLP